MSVKKIKNIWMKCSPLWFWLKNHYRTDCICMPYPVVHRHYWNRFSSIISGSASNNRFQAVGRISRMGRMNHHCILATSSPRWVRSRKQAVMGISMLQLPVKTLEPENTADFARFGVNPTG
jgi:hypothetical protein